MYVSKAMKGCQNVGLTKIDFKIMLYNIAIWFLSHLTRILESEKVFPRHASREC